MLTIKSTLSCALAFAGAVSAFTNTGIFDTTIDPRPFPTTIFSQCKTADPAAVTYDPPPWLSDNMALG